MTSVSTDIRRGLIYAGLIIAVAGGAKIAAAHGVLGGDWPARAMVAVIGAFLMATGNAIPKTLTPLSACSYDPANRLTLLLAPVTALFVVQLFRLRGAGRPA